VQDVQAVSVEQCARFPPALLSAAHAEFAAVGDLDAAAVRERRWKRPSATGAHRPPARWPTCVPRPVAGRAAGALRRRHARPANANLLAVLALPLSDTDADYPALLVANYLFGRPGSRLWERIREREG
jgi:zinc protease